MSLASFRADPFVREMLAESDRIVPLMRRHGLDAVKIVPAGGAYDAKRGARDNIKHDNFSARPAMQFGHDRPARDKFDDRYGDEAGEITGGAPKYSWHGQEHTEGDDIEPNAHERLMQFLASCGLNEEDCNTACEIAGAGQMSGDDLPTSASSTGSPPVGSAGPVRYSSRGRDYDPDYYTGTGEAYTARGAARSPGNVGSDEPHDLPTGMMPLPGGSMTPKRQPAQDAPGYSSVKTPLMHALGQMHDQRVAKICHGDLAKTQSPPSYRSTYERQVGRAFSVGASDQAGPSMFEWECSPKKTRKQLAQDRARAGADYAGNRAEFLARFPDAARIGGV
jgi:hypothetical protein